MATLQVAVVTGGSRGIGRAIIDRFLQGEDWNVVAIDVNPVERTNSRLRSVRADVGNADMVCRAFESIATTEGEIAALVNNAGIQRVALIHKMPILSWQEVINTNLTGAFLCSQQAIPLFGLSGGAIVNISSVASQLGLSGRGPYCSAKAGLLGLTRVMALELAERGVRVNAVAPGFTRTELIAEGLENGSLEEEWMIRRVPMARLADPAEIAAAVHFLCSADASFITGQCVVVDGGWSIQGLPEVPDWLESEVPGRA